MGVTLPCAFESCGVLSKGDSTPPDTTPLHPASIPVNLSHSSSPTDIRLLRPICFFFANGEAFKPSESVAWC